MFFPFFKGNDLSPLSLPLHTTLHTSFTGGFCSPQCSSFPIHYANIFLPLTAHPHFTPFIGDSTVSNIKKKAAAPFCFPRTKVLYIMEKIQSILAEHPLAWDVVIHGDCYDVL